MKPNKCLGLRCRLTQPTRNGQGIEFENLVCSIPTNYQAIIAGAGNIVWENIANSDVLYYNVEHSVLVTLVGHNVFVIEHEKSQSGLQYLAEQCNS
jgi:hypothetical protein